jgi:hypothetical protein
MLLWQLTWLLLLLCVQLRVAVVGGGTGEVLAAAGITPEFTATKVRQLQKQQQQRQQAAAQFPRAAAAAYGSLWRQNAQRGQGAQFVAAPPIACKRIWGQQQKSPRTRSCKLS